MLNLFCSNTILADLTEWSIYGKPRLSLLRIENLKLNIIHLCILNVCQCEWSALWKSSSLTICWIFVCLGSFFWGKQQHYILNVCCCDLVSVEYHNYLLKLNVCISWCFFTLRDKNSADENGSFCIYLIFNGKYFWFMFLVSSKMKTHVNII